MSSEITKEIYHLLDPRL